MLPPNVKLGILAPWLRGTKETKAPVPATPLPLVEIVEERESPLPKEFTFKTPPWGHQKLGVEKQVPYDNFGYLYEVGTGKTKTIIDVLRYRYGLNRGVMKTLIVCPPIVIQNWPNEFKIHSNVQKSDVICITGTGKQRLATFKEFANRTRIFVTNFETLLMEDLHKEMLAYGFDVMVVDEAHYLKNPTARRSKAIYALGDKVKYRYILTGTPILNSPMDIFGIFRFLDAGETFGRNQFAFRNIYFYDKNANMKKQNYFPNWQPRSSMMQSLAEKIETITHHVKKAECLDLPPLVRKRLTVELSSEQRRLYNEMKQDLLACVEGKGVAVAQLALTKMLRMQQIISGHVNVERFGENGETIKEIYKVKDNPRARALEETLETLTLQHKVIVWAIFKTDYDIIRDVCEKLKIESVEVHGGISQKQKDIAVNRFNTEEAVRVFIGHPQSGGIGINLVVSDITVYYSRSFNLADDIQSEARNYRGGSERHESVTRIDIVAEKTVDEMVLERLLHKQQIGDDILINLVKELRENG